MNTIQHFGVKGMRWGVRRARGHYSDRKRDSIKEYFRKVIDGRKVDKKNRQILKKFDKGSETKPSKEVEEAYYHKMARDNIKKHLQFRQNRSIKTRLKRLYNDRSKMNALDLEYNLNKLLYEAAINNLNRKHAFRKKTKNAIKSSIEYYKNQDKILERTYKRLKKKEMR